MSNNRNSEIIEMSSNETSSSENRSYVISGSFAQAFITDMFVAYTARSVVGAFNPPVTEMTQLNQTLKGLLAASPLVSTLLTQIPMAHRISRTGGKREALFIIAGTLTGMSALTAISYYTDITTISNMDWRYVTMLASGYLIGLGSGLFPLMINSFKWARSPDHLYNIQAVYSAVVDSSSITTPIIIYSLKPYGYVAPFGLYVGIISIGGLAAIKFLRKPPYEQLKRRFSKAQSKELAIHSGQLEMMIRDNDHSSFLDVVKTSFRLLLDRRGMALNFAMFATLGSFFVTETIFPSLLTNGYKVSTANAIYTSSFANLITIAARLAAGKIVTKWDARSGGVKVYLLGCGITIAAAIPLSFSNLPSWALYSSIAAINVGFGIAIIPPLNIAGVWSKPVNENLEEYDPDSIFGILGSMGTLGGILLPIVLGLMVNGLGSEGYQYYFLLIITMMLASAIALPLVDFNVKHHSYESFFDKPLTLFNQMRNSSAIARVEQHEKKSQHQVQLT